MRNTLYVQGAVADALGSKIMTDLARALADMTDAPIDLLTHGPSEFHAESRFSAEPKGYGKAQHVRAALELNSESRER